MNHVKQFVINFQLVKIKKKLTNSRSYIMNNY